MEKEYHERRIQELKKKRENFMISRDQFLQVAENSLAEANKCLGGIIEHEAILKSMEDKPKE